MRRGLVLLIVGLIFFACSGKKAENKAIDKGTAGNKAPVLDEKALFEQAQNYEKSNDYVKSCELYQSFVDNYPQSPNRYKALFMTGYFQLEYLKNPKKAEKIFDTLLKEYPECDLADDAKFMQSVAASGKDLDQVFQDSLNAK